ncbi:MAG: hypothetical protein NT016_02930 [Candidatus Aenigmarchaeota archaeon]|nr:hypothetical protein [Candidatus Aenigmarchaeota archaeon]
MPQGPRQMNRGKDYDEFIRSEAAQSEHTLYETACGYADRLLHLPPWKGLDDKYAEAITFSHLKVTPRSAFSLVVLATLLTALVPAAVAFPLHQLSQSTAAIIAIIVTAVFFYLYDYPTHHATVFRIRASAEMVLATVYMTISMRISPNIENAIKFSADNLSGPLAMDLNQLLWDIYTRKYNTAAAGMDWFIDKWKRDNSEFADALYLVKTATIESQSRREKVLDEAVSVILQGTRNRMKDYSLELRTPVTVINALGILLPIIGMVFLPMMGIFMPDAIQPIFIAIGYNVMLPLVVYWLMSTYLDKRPYSFHNPDMSDNPKFRNEKKWVYPAIGLVVAVPLIAFGLYGVFTATGVFSFNQLISSLIVSVGICGGIVAYSISYAIGKMKLRDEVVQIENEFIEVLFQLGNQLMRGVPFEMTLRTVTPQIRDLKISKFFDRVLYNIETFGMTLEQAVFDEKQGAIHDYPSRMIKAIMHAVVEISKRGMDTTSRAMITISTYMKNSRQVEAELKDMLSEVTSTMQMQAMLLAPLSSGIVVALAALIMNMLLMLNKTVEQMYGAFTGAGPLGVSGGLFDSVLRVDKMMSVQSFQLIVSIYMIEVVGMLAVFLSIIQNGDEDLLKRMTLGKTLIMAFAIYAIVMVAGYSVFSALIPMTGLAQ